MSALVPYVCHTPRHSCRKVATSITEHYHSAPSHILTAMVARTLYHGNGSRVAYGKPFAHPSVDIDLSAGSSVKSGIASDNVVLGNEVDL